MKKSRIFMTLHLAFWVAVGSILQVGAYIDPSVATTLVTAIAGAVVALSASFFIIWRKTKSKVSRVLGVDENANKEVEDELIIKDEKTEETKDE